MNYPSVKRIAQVCNVDTETAYKVRKVMDGRLSPDTVPATQAWLDQCYNRPRVHELKMHAIDVLLGNYGVEYAAGIKLEYSNTGDSYAGTVLFRNGRYSVGSWGDIAEREGG